MIPEHCIKLFEAKYGLYPSHTIVSMSKDIFERIIRRSEMIWCKHSIDNVDGEYIDVMLSSLYSFHEEGIYIYLDEIKEDQIGTSTRKAKVYNVYFMFETSRKHIVDFTIKQIINEMKNGN